MQGFSENTILKACRERKLLSVTMFRNNNFRYFIFIEFIWSHIFTFHQKC